MSGSEHLGRIAGSHWGDSSPFTARGSRAMDLYGWRDGLMLALTEDDETVGADEIRLDVNGASRLMLLLAAWLARWVKRQPDRGVSVRGVVAQNGRGQICFFPAAGADGVPLPSNTLDPAWDALLSAIENAPARRLTHAHLRALDPPR